jgi:actin cytoskeleton-regulatory complex protein SLA1
LLNPLIPTTTGFSGFVPTRQSPNPPGMMPQQTGFQGGLMSQQTGFQPMYAQQPQQQTYMQPSKYIAELAVRSLQLS